MTQKAERLPLLVLCQVVLRSWRARTTRGGARGPCRRLLLLAQGGHLRMTESDTCHPPPAERLARQEPPRAEEEPAGQEGRRREAPPWPPLGSAPPDASPPESRDGGGSAGHMTRDAAAAAELRRARPDSGDSPTEGRGPGLGVAMTEKRRARSMRSRAWEGVKEGAN